MNRRVSLEIGPPPLKQIRSLPPVASRTFLNTTASKTPTPGRLFSSSQLLAARAPQKRFLVIAPPALTLVMIPFLTVSQTAGTPTKTVGLNSLMSPLQFRTLASESVRKLP